MQENLFLIFQAILIFCCISFGISGAFEQNDDQERRFVTKVAGWWYVGLAVTLTAIVVGQIML